MKGGTKHVKSRWSVEGVKGERRLFLQCNVIKITVFLLVINVLLPKE